MNRKVWRMLMLSNHAMPIDTPPLGSQKKQKLKKVEGGREISVNMSKIP